MRDALAVPGLGSACLEPQCCGPRPKVPLELAQDSSGAVLEPFDVATAWRAMDHSICPYVTLAPVYPRPIRLGCSRNSSRPTMPSPQEGRHRLGTCDIKAHHRDARRQNLGRVWRGEDRGCVRASTNCRGDEDIDAKRPRPSIGKPAIGSREEKARAFDWDRSADHIRAAGQTAAFEGRIHDRTRTLR